MLADSTLLLRAKEKYPNSYLLVRLVNQRVTQLGAHAMNGQSTRSLVHRAMEDAAAGELRLESVRAEELSREDAGDLIKWPD
jgi:DNA-directed RNA polymerase subunit K/omega